jgi:hypothetical protein
MKLYMSLIVINLVFYSCKEKMTEGVICKNIEEIRILNKNGDTSITKSIIINDRNLFNEFCKLIPASKGINRPNVKDHSGFYEIIIRFKDNTKLGVYIIFTHYDGIVVRSRMRYYRNADLVELTEQLFRSKTK